MIDLDVELNMAWRAVHEPQTSTAPPYYPSSAPGRPPPQNTSLCFSLLEAIKYYLSRLEARQYAPKGSLRDASTEGRLP